MKRSRMKAVFRAALALTILASANAMAGGLFAPAFDTGNFPGLADTPNINPIDNQYWPMPVGTTYIYFTETEDGCEWDEVDITDRTMTIDGIEALVSPDKVWLDDSENCADQLDNYPTGFPYGELTEATEDYFAQDNSGNIWYMGEYTIDKTVDEEDCDDWVENDTTLGILLTGCRDGSFLAGEGDAEPGIVMMADPAHGDFYRQEYDEGNAEDWGKVLNFVPAEDYAGEYEGCLETKEWSPLEHGDIEHKYYCPDADGGAGALVQVEAVSGGPTEWSDLIDIIHN